MHQSPSWVSVCLCLIWMLLYTFDFRHNCTLMHSCGIVHTVCGLCKEEGSTTTGIYLWDYDCSSTGGMMMITVKLTGEMVALSAMWGRIAPLDCTWELHCIMQCREHFFYWCQTIARVYIQSIKVIRISYYSDITLSCNALPPIVLTSRVHDGIDTHSLGTRVCSHTRPTSAIQCTCIWESTSCLTCM